MIHIDTVFSYDADNRYCVVFRSDRIFYDLTANTGKEIVMPSKKVVLDKKKIDVLSQENKVFYIAEYNMYLVYTERAKEAVKALLRS